MISLTLVLSGNYSFGMTKFAPPLAHAAKWGSRAVDDGVVVEVVPPSTTSHARKYVKAIVNVGAVAAGVASARGVRRVLDDDHRRRSDRGGTRSVDDDRTGDADASAAAADDDDVARDVAAAAVARDLAGTVVTMGGGGDASSSPLSMEWIERELRDANGESDEKSMPSSSPPPPPAHVGQWKVDPNPTILVKDLDAKIEMLRAREEEVARVNAERTRIEEDERIAAEAKREEEARWVRERIELEESRRMAAAAALAAEREAEEEARKRAAVELVARESRGSEEEEVARMPMEGGATGTKAEPGPKTWIGIDNRDSAAVDIAQARQQPKSMEEERRLQEKYGKIEDLEERAFNILVDLGMVNLHSDPADSTLESEEDD